MIFGNLILGGFGILMSNMSQVPNILFFRFVTKWCYVTAPYCRDWEPRYPQTHPSDSDFHECHSDAHQTSLRHPPDISREQEMPKDKNRHKQTAPNTERHWKVLFEYIWRCLLASCVVCWHLLLPGDVWWVSGGCLVGIWGYLNDIHGNWRHSGVFGGIWALSPCSMEP